MQPADMGEHSRLVRQQHQKQEQTVMLAGCGARGRDLRGAQGSLRGVFNGCGDLVGGERGDRQQRQQAP
jgi:hypothetical protein